MKFRMPDDKIISGRSYADILRGMADEKMTPAKDMDRYRRALAERVSGLYGTEVDASSDSALVRSLERVGLITKVA